MSLREAAQQALEALEVYPFEDATKRNVYAPVIIMLKGALAIPGNDYERGFVDGMSHQAQSSVDRAVNAMARKPLSDEKIWDLYYEMIQDDRLSFARAVERAHGIGGEA
jgi:hypothetical protein